MLPKIEKIAVLKGSGLFASAPDHLLLTIAGLVEEQEFDVGKPLYLKGETGTSMFFVVRGEVRIHDGDRELRIVTDGEPFGELGVFDRGPRPATATATHDAMVLQLDEDVFNDLITEHPEVAMNAIDLLVARLWGSPP